MSTLRIDNIKSVCRCCLSLDDEMINMFSSLETRNIDINRKQLTMYDLYRNCTQIFFSDGELPLNICSKCCCRLKEIFAFRNECLKSHYILKEIINSTEHKHKEKPEELTNIDYSFNDNNSFREKGCKKQAMSAPRKKVSGAENRKRAEDKIEEVNKSASKISKWLHKAGASLSSTNTSDTISDTCKQSNSNSIEPLSITNDLLKEEMSNKKAKQKMSLGKSLTNMINYKDSAFTNRNKLPKLNNKPDIKKYHECTTCGNEFSTARGLKLHVRLHTGERPEICNICKKTFSDPRTLINHQKCHTGLKPFKCEYCDKRFTHKKPLQYHMKTHTGERPHICDICGKTYIQPYNLVVHKRVHSDERPFICNECGKSFTSHGTLRLHMTIHTGIKNFVCTICGKTFARSSELTIHMRIHSGERPYQCNVCNKSFIKRSNLQIHYTTHTGEKKFMCSVCGHQAPYLCRLKVHMKQHLGLKMFKCALCDKDCTNKADLRAHIQLHSAKKYLEAAENIVKNPNNKFKNTINKITNKPDADTINTNS